MLRTPTAAEQERMHGYPTGYTQLRIGGPDWEGHPTEDDRKSLLGNSFSCVAVAVLLGSWAVLEGYLERELTAKELWLAAAEDSAHLAPEGPRSDIVRTLLPPDR